MAAYYNERDPFAAAWLKNLVTARLIAPGDVDDRSIEQVKPDDVRGYAQCHFFAGIAGWSYALRLAGWPDDRKCWTGSCPCQPFSAAGKGEAFEDERHLWPVWFELIRAVRPPVILGEQVEDAIGWGWLDLVHDDMEAEGYAIRSAVLPACGVGAPHIRDRLWFCGLLGDADSTQADTAEQGQSLLGAGCPDDVLAHTAEPRRRSQPQRPAGTDGRPEAQSGRLRHAGELGDAGSPGSQERVSNGRLQREAMERDTRQAVVGGSDARPWSDLECLPCTDGKARPTKPGLFPLAHGVSARVGKLRAAGNAIVPQVAAEFIKAVMQSPRPGGE